MPSLLNPAPRIRHLLSGALLTLAFASSAHAAEALQPLLVANQKSALKVLLEASGELKDVPYEIRFSEFPSASPLGEALNAGAVDVGALGDAPYVFALGAGASLKVISITHVSGRYTTALIVRNDSPVKQVADLKGKRIVTGRGSIGHYLAIRALNEAGLQSSDVKFVYLLPSESRLILDNGEADAWATWAPYTTVATQNGARILPNGPDLLTNHSYLAATSKAIAEKRAQLDDFVVRLDRAYRWTNSHPAEYAAAQAKVTGLPVEVHLATAKETTMERVSIDDGVIKGLQNTADIYLREGILNKHVDVSQGFDAGFNEIRLTAEQTALKKDAQAAR
jgi:sulfonate transport system substrate-binding protein